MASSPAERVVHEVRKGFRKVVIPKLTFLSIGLQDFDSDLGVAMRSEKTDVATAIFNSASTLYWWVCLKLLYASISFYREQGTEGTLILLLDFFVTCP
jgi:hypothetical protein